MPISKRLFLTVWRLGSSNQGCWQIQCLMRPASWLTVGGQGALLGLFWVHSPIHGKAIFMKPNHLPKAPTPNSVYWDPEFSTWIWGDTKIQSVAQMGSVINGVWERVTQENNWWVDWKHISCVFSLFATKLTYLTFPTISCQYDLHFTDKETEV